MSLFSRNPHCLPHIVAAWTGWICPCGQDIADHASWGDGYCNKCRCTKAYLGYQRAPDAPLPTITVNGIELVEVQL